MPDKCCIPNCNANYPSKSGYTPVFRFPSDENLHQAWVRKIPRKNWTPSKWAVVCINHFHERDIIRIEKYKDASGEWRERPMDRLKLVPGALPTIFPDLPSYLSTPETKKRRNPEERRVRQAEAITVKEQELLDKDIIINFSNFSSNIHQQLQFQKQWLVYSSSEYMVLYQCNFQNIPQISVSLKILNDMSCEMCVNQNILARSELRDILAANLKLTRWSQLHHILKKYEGAEKDQAICNQNVDSVLAVIIDKLRLILSLLAENGNLLSSVERQINFTIEHLSLVFSKARRYSTEFILWAFMVYMHSSNCYAAIRETSWIVLPHIKYLQHLTSIFSVSPSSTGNNEHFLKNAIKKLTERERLVSLQIDEMHIKPHISYKSGNLIGFAENQQNTEAKTVQAFLVASLFGSFKEVVALHPVKNLTGTDLHNLIDVVIDLLRKCGFHIIIIVSDNHRVNRNMFDQLQSASDDYFSDNIDPPYRTFLTYDFVHLLKNIRNCWINKKDAFQSLTFPDFEDPTSLLTAKFSDLKRLYHKSNHACRLLQPAHKLNHRTLYPSNLERQKVSLACNVFHETTYSALKSEMESESGIDISEGTFKFINIILKWWTIVNVKSKLLGTLKRNQWADPFYSVEDDRLKFLRQFLVWLQHWELIKEAGLTTDTHRALFQSTSVLIHFIEYSLSTLNVEFVLPGKLQTDNLEERFSCYRQLSGGNYNVSYVQVMEAEKKLRMKSLLGIKSARYGVLKWSTESVKELDNIGSVGAHRRMLDVSPFLCIVRETNIFDFTPNNSSLLYISGYASFVVSSKLDCSLCLDCVLGKDMSANDTYFDTLNRGGLTIPSDLAYYIAYTVCCILSLLISNAHHEDMFLKCGNQKELLVVLSKTFLFDDNGFPSDVCLCGMENSALCVKIISVVVNILLNNYSKARNDAVAASKVVCQKRKLDTLH